MNHFLLNLIKFEATFQHQAKAVPRRFLNRQKNREKIFTPQDRKIQYTPFQALQLMRVHSFTSFVESVEVCIKLGVNPKNGEQIVRGTASMPSGLGKDVKIAVLCQPEQVQEVKAAGADLIIDDEQIKKIAKGETNFQMLFTTQDLLPKIKQYGRLLGPKGLMPNPKVGTLLAKKQGLAPAIKEAKSGQVTFRVDSGRNLHAPIGKFNFTDEQLMKNFKSLMETLSEKKPTSLKGKYFIEAYLKSTMGPSWKLNMSLIDPKNQSNIWQLIQ